MLQMSSFLVGLHETWGRGQGPTLILWFRATLPPPTCFVSGLLFKAKVQVLLELPF